MSGVDLRHKAPLALIKLARRAFANTPVQRLAIVTWLYRKTVAFAWRQAEVTADFRGVSLTVAGRDSWLPPALVGGFYEAIELDLLERLAARCDVVVDVGANIGIHTCVAASRLPAGGRLIAFEPAPTNLEYLRRNLDRNGLLDRVRVEPLAVGEAPGETLLHLDADSGGNNSLAPDMVPNSTGTVSVPVTSLDAYLAGTPVDLLKVDVEGYDGYVLRGAAALLHEHRPTLLVEFVPGHLVRAGFSVTEFLDRIFDLYPDVWIVDEPKRRLERCARADLARYERRGVSHNLNLIAIARPEHRAVVDEFMAVSSHVSDS